MRNTRTYTHIHINEYPCTIVKAQKKGKGQGKKKGGKGSNKGGNKQKNNQKNNNQNNQKNNKNANQNKNKNNKIKNKNNENEEKIDETAEIRGINLVKLEDYTKKGQTFPPSKTIDELFDNPLFPKDFPVNQTMPHPGREGK